MITLPIYSKTCLPSRIPNFFTLFTFFCVPACFFFFFLALAATVVIVVWTHDLAQGVLAGVILSGLFFASKVKRLFTVTSELSADGNARTYRVAGQVFFASSDSFTSAFDYKEVLDRVVIDVSNAHFWDISAIGALEKAVERMRRNGRSVQVVGLNRASSDLVDKFALTDKTGVEIGLAPHP